MGDPVKLIGEDPVISGYLNRDLNYSKKDATLSGTVTWIRIYVSTAGVGKAALYSDSGGDPSNLLGFSNEYTLSVGLNDLSLINPVEIIEGNSYWIAIATSSACRITGTNNGQYRATPTNDGFVYSSEYEFPNPAEYVKIYTWRTYAAGWGSLASGGAGRLIGSKSRLIGGPSPLIGGPSPLIG